MEEKLRKLMLAMIAYNNGDAKRIQHFIKRRQTYSALY